MSLFTNPTPQLLDDNAKPLPGAKLFFFETGTSTLKTIYADSSFTTAQSNPVVADGNGRITSDVYLDGVYRVLGQTAEGVNIDGWDKDPVGEVESGQFDAWSNDATYNIPDIVKGSDNEYYESLTNDNQGNDPTTDAVNWVLLKLLTDAENDAISTSKNTVFYGGASSVGTDAYAATLSDPPAAYAAGQTFSWLADVANAGACTVDFNGIGAVSIKMPDGSDPFDGAIQASSIPIVENDGTNFILQNPYYKDDYVGLTGDETIAGVKTFTGGISTESTIPAQAFVETDATADEGYWRWFVNGDVFRFQIRDDAVSTGEDIFTATRTGATVDIFDFPNGIVTGNFGPAAVSGYTKIGSGIYRKDSAGLSPISLTFNSLATVAAPTGANGVILKLTTLSLSQNTTGVRRNTIRGYSDAGTTTCLAISNEGNEQVATAGAVTLQAIGKEVTLPVISGNFYLKWSSSDNSSTSACSYEIVGYTV